MGLGQRAWLVTLLILLLPRPVIAIDEARISSIRGIIEVQPDLTHPPQDAIIARGTEADTLESAEIRKAVGIIAATDNDVNNLSILITARELKPDIFTIARQQSSANTEIFKAANMQPDFKISPACGRSR